MVTELNQKEVSDIFGGLGFVAFTLIGATVTGLHSTFRIWQGGACNGWKASGWSSKEICVVTNVVEDVLFYGIALPVMGKYLAPTPAAVPVKKD